jgi:hypothetical protein
MIKLPISRKAVRCRDNAMLNKEGEQGGSFVLQHVGMAAVC